jgi:hypothetical protein
VRKAKADSSAISNASGVAQVYELTSNAKGQVKNLTRAWATACQAIREGRDFQGHAIDADAVRSMHRAITGDTGPRRLSMADHVTTPGGQEWDQDLVRRHIADLWENGKPIPSVSPD